MPRSARPRAAALFLLMALVASACGTRLSEADLQAELAGGAPETVSLPAEGAPSGPAEGGRTPGGERSATAPSAGVSSSAATVPVAEAPGGAPGGSGKDGKKKKAVAPCTSNPGSTAAGVTGSSVRVGGSYAESSLIPGQFRPAMDGIQAYLRMANREGGVCGRTIDFHFHNDGLNAQRYGENVRHLAEEDGVFALLGGLSASDSGGCGFMASQVPPTGIPDIGTFALNYCRSQHPTFYSPMGSLKPGIYGCCGDWQWLRQRFGFSKPSAHWLDVEISRDQGLAVVDALTRTIGGSSRSAIHQGEHSAAQFSYAGDVNDMREAGVDAVWSSMDINANVKLLRAMCQQEWVPKVVHVEISTYDPAFIERVGGDCLAKQNVWMRSFHLAFAQPNDEVALYMKELKAFCPACEPTTFGLEGWLSAKLFVEVLREVGPNLTRPAFYAAMNAVSGWTGDGVMGPNSPRDRLIYHCNVMINVRPGGFFQERGFDCGDFYASGDYTAPPVGP